MARVSTLTICLALRALPTGEPHRAARPVPADEGDGVPFGEVAQPKPGTWPTYHGHLDGNRFSPLEQINAGMFSMSRRNGCSRFAALHAICRSHRSWPAGSCT